MRRRCQAFWAISTATPPPPPVRAPSQADARPITLTEERVGEGERSSPTHRDMPGMKRVIGHELPPPAPRRTSLALSATAPSGIPPSSSAIVVDDKRLWRSDAERCCFLSDRPGFVRLRRFDGLGEASGTREAPPPTMTSEPSTVTSGEGGGRSGLRRRMRSAPWLHRLWVAKKRRRHTTQKKRRRWKRHSPWRLR